MTCALLNGPSPLLFGTLEQLIEGRWTEGSVRQLAALFAQCEGSELRQIMTREIFTGIHRTVHEQSNMTEECLDEVSQLVLQLDDSVPGSESVFIGVIAQLCQRAPAGTIISLVEKLNEREIYFASHSVEWIQVLSPLLLRKQSRVRLVSLHTVDSILRSNPWKTTFPSISHLLGRNPNPQEISITEFFAPSGRHNFIASLIIDPQLRVKRAVFECLTKWMTELDDSADMEIHLAPFWLSGFFDPEVKEYIESELKPRIIAAEQARRGPDRSSDLFTNWVTRQSRNFIPALVRGVFNSDDFENVTFENRVKLLDVVLQFSRPELAAEWIVPVFALVERALSRGGCRSESVLLRIAVIAARSTGDWLPFWQGMGGENMTVGKERMVEAFLTEEELHVSPVMVVELGRNGLLKNLTFLKWLVSKVDTSTDVIVFAIRLGHDGLRTIQYGKSFPASSIEEAIKYFVKSRLMPAACLDTILSWRDVQGDVVDRVLVPYVQNEYPRLAPSVQSRVVSLLDRERVWTLLEGTETGIDPLLDRLEVLGVGEGYEEQSHGLLDRFGVDTPVGRRLVWIAGGLEMAIKILERADSRKSVLTALMVVEKHTVDETVVGVVVARAMRVCESRPAANVAVVTPTEIESLSETGLDIQDRIFSSVSRIVQRCTDSVIARLMHQWVIDGDWDRVQFVAKLRN
jgi:hypothetical protein